jgi:hypothetical protein
MAKISSMELESRIEGLENLVDGLEALGESMSPVTEGFIDGPTQAMVTVAVHGTGAYASLFAEEVALLKRWLQTLEIESVEPVAKAS